MSDLLNAMDSDGEVHVKYEPPNEVRIPLTSITSFVPNTTRTYQGERRHRSEEMSARFSQPTEVTMLNTHPSNVTQFRARVFDLHPEDTPQIMLASTRRKQRMIEPITIFQMIWTTDIAEKWCALTNQRIHRMYETTATSDRENVSHHQLVEPLDLYHLIGILLLKRELSGTDDGDIWSSHCTGSGPIPTIIRTIKSAMSLQRYRRLHNMCCFSEQIPDNDRDYIHRMDWLADRLFTNSRALYVPTRIVTLDDQSIRFFGRAPHKRGPRNKKADKCALEMDALNDMKGFTLAMKMRYNPERSVAKRQNEPERSIQSKQEACLTKNEEQIGKKNNNALALIKKSFRDTRQHEVIMDSWYTNHNLFEELSKLGMRATGTIRSNWITYGLPHLKISKKQSHLLQKGM